jgi:hypothetical protein
LVIMPPRPIELPAPPAIALERGVARDHARQQRRRRVPCADRRCRGRLVGQDHQRVGVDQVGHQRAERVVVADLDLVGDHRVVLVDDRHDAQPEQRRSVERAFR